MGAFPAFRTCICAVSERRLIGAEDKLAALELHPDLI